MINQELLNKYMGALLGLAIGDALGTTLEFKDPGDFEPIEEIIGGGPFNLQPGQWTDDTSMALCLAASLIEKKNFDVFDQMSKYYKWYKDGYMSSASFCFDIGITTKNALLLFHQTGQPITGSTDRMTAGNGSIMRLAPVPLFFRENLLEAISRSAISSKTTHAAPQAVDSCKYLAWLIVHALNGTAKETLLSSEAANSFLMLNKVDGEVEEIIVGSFKIKNPPEIQGSGYVVRSLEAALWAFYKTSNFKDGALMAVNLGDDADTTGAVYGQIAGAFYGKSGIPKEWLDVLHRRDQIENMAVELYKLSSAKH